LALNRDEYEVNGLSVSDLWMAAACWQYLATRELRFCPDQEDAVATFHLVLEPE
jgi:hypothetical protein